MTARQVDSLSLASLIAVIVLSTALLLTGAFLYTVNRESHAAAPASADKQFKEIASKVFSGINVVLQSISTLTDTAALLFQTNTGPNTDEELSKKLPVMKHILDANAQLLSAYAGFADGAFYQVLAPRGDAQVLATYNAPAGTEYVERVLFVDKDGARRQIWRFRNGDLDVLSHRLEDGDTYDPRKRIWYMEALKAGRPVFTTPYVFSSSRMPGVTCAHPLEGGRGVFGVDVSLKQLGELLAAQRVSPNGLAWVVDAAGRLVTAPGMNWRRQAGEELELQKAVESNHPLIRAAGVASGEGLGRSTDLAFLDVDGERWVYAATAAPDEFGLKVAVAAAAPLKDMTGHIDVMVRRIVATAAGVLILAVPLAMWIGRRTVRPVVRLLEEAEKIQRFDFSPSPEIRSRITEVKRLASAAELMKATIRSKTEGLIDTQGKLEKLVEGGLALAAEKDMAKLVNLIFMTARDIAKADGGVVYLKQGDELGVEMLSLNDASLVLGGLSDNPAPRVIVRPEIASLLSRDSVLRHACEAFKEKRILMTGGVSMSLFPTGLPEEPDDFVIGSLLSVPVVSRRNEVLGVIQLFNPDLGESVGEETVGDVDVQRFIGALAAQTAVTLDNRNLIRSLQEVFDSLILVVASAIDAKSAYTSGHCSRVPALAEMLARAAHNVDEGPLADFRMESEEAWRRLWIAAWMHDCGKVTTPEYVVDKAVKLETIYNRFHEIRMRFEVLRRDAEIGHLLRLIAGDDAGISLRRFHERIAELESEYAFLAQCNEGGEFMTDEDKERVRVVAGRTWTRHFSDRIGISAEEARLKGDAKEALPVQERLLSDKQEHCIARLKDYSRMRDAQGNPIEAPEYEYNRGEMYNLCISRGTLTAEEFFKIKEHTFIGLEMLRRIPFPKEYGLVAEIAAAHHETLAGTGYPFKKTKAQLPVEARILAIADVFEALTAADRPYKKAKPLSEVLKIMTFMRKDQHIDPDIFDVFLRKGVCLEYAQKHLDPSQIDVADLSPYLSTSH